jgi:hypothetical protein
MAPRLWLKEQLMPQEQPPKELSRHLSEEELGSEEEAWKRHRQRLRQQAYPNRQPQEQQSQAEPSTGPGQKPQL